MTKDLRLQMPPELLKFIEEDIPNQVQGCDDCEERRKKTGDTLLMCPQHSHQQGFRTGALQAFDILRNDLNWHSQKNCFQNVMFDRIIKEVVEERKWHTGKDCPVGFNAGYLKAQEELRKNGWHEQANCPTTLEIKKEAAEIINNLVGFHSMDTKELLLKVRTAVASYQDGRLKERNECIKQVSLKIKELKEVLSNEFCECNDGCDRAGESCRFCNYMEELIDKTFFQSNAGVLQSGGGTQVICKALSTSVPTEDASNRTPDKPTS